MKEIFYEFLVLEGALFQFLEMSNKPFDHLTSGKYKPIDWMIDSFIWPVASFNYWQRLNLKWEKIVRDYERAAV